LSLSIFAARIQGKPSLSETWQLNRRHASQQHRQINHMINGGMHGTRRAGPQLQV